jgi:lambda family phage tail tape measure protein
MLANLNIIVNTNAQQAAASMQMFGGEARTQMNNSARAADDFSQRMSASSQNVQQAAGRISANMTAANDAIIQKSAETEEAINRMGSALDNVDTRGFAERFGEAFGAAFGAGYAAAQTWMQKTEDYVKEKAKTIAIGLAIGLVGATAAAVYTGYKVISGTLGFVEGLFTGESYKSANIDALIAANNQVKELQRNLNVSAVEAAALADAMGRLGVDKSGYVETYNKATTAMHANTEELDRLGVKYKDANGQLLTQAQFLENVKTKLEEYKEGYDRAAAASAIGAGSYEAVTNALKINDQQLEQSKSRLDDYLLGIGPNTQAAVAAYEQSMRDFNNEAKLTSEGFKRAVADNIMPALTNLADFFKDGFPFAVRAFRYSFATVTSLFFGLQTVVYVVTESVLGSIESIGIGIGALGTAFYRAVTGDMAGAKQALVQGWEEAQNRFAQIGDNIVAQARNNRDAMALAWGLDDRMQSIGEARAEAAQRNEGLKSWTPKPAKKDDSGQSAYAAYLAELDRMAAKIEQNEYASLRLKAAQLAEKEGVTDLSAAYDKITKIQRAESQRAIDAYTDKLALENTQYAQQTELLVLNAQQQEIATMVLKRHYEMEQQIIAARNAKKPLDDQAIADLKANTEAQIQAMTALIEARQNLERSFSYGTIKALQQYIDDSSNAAKQAQMVWGNAFKSMEDALVNFVQTGKLDFKGLVNSILADISRIYVQKNITQPLAQWLFGGGASRAGGADNIDIGGGWSPAGGGGSPASAISSWISSLLSFDVGTPYVPRDMLAQIHEGERIVPKGQNGAGGGGVTIVQHQTFQGGADPATLAQWGQQVKAATLAEVAYRMKSGSPQFA